jgi:hypothetical protein
VTTLAKLFMPENKLKKKVGHGGFSNATLESAQKAIENNDIDFKPIADEMLDQINQLLDTAKITADFDESTLMDDFLYPLMQLKSQGALFHYPIVTKISDTVVDILENIPVLDKNVIEIIEAYAKSVKAMMMLEIKNENNKMGLELCQALSDACQRYYKLHSKNTQ